MNRRPSECMARLATVAGLACLLAGCTQTRQHEVVVYTSVDDVFARGA